MNNFMYILFGDKNFETVLRSRGINTDKEFAVIIDKESKDETAKEILNLVKKYANVGEGVANG